MGSLRTAGKRSKGRRTVGSPASPTSDTRRLFLLPKYQLFTKARERFAKYQFIVRKGVREENFDRVVVYMVQGDLDRIALSVAVRQFYSNVANDSDSPDFLLARHFPERTLQRFNHVLRLRVVRFRVINADPADSSVAIQ